MLKKAGFILAISLFLAPIFFVRAQESTTISLSPPSFELEGLPGNVITNTIKVSNPSDQAITVKAKAQNFVAYGEGGSVALTEEESSFAINRWISIPNATVSIKPHASENVTFTLTVPKNAEPGSHYGAIVFTSQGGSITGSGASISQQVGTLILMKLPGDTFENINLISFKPESTLFQTPQIKLDALLENTGTVHSKPYGFITLTNIIGKKVKTWEVRGRNILPKSRRIFDEVIPFNGFGYYKADITLLYAGGGKIVKAQTTFFQVNRSKATKILIIVGILLVLYLLFRKRINQAVRILIRGT